MSDFDKEVAKVRFQHKQKKEERLAEYRKNLERLVEEEFDHLDIDETKKRIIKTTQQSRYRCYLAGVALPTDYKLTQGFFHNRKVLYDFKDEDTYKKELVKIVSDINLLQRVKNLLDFNEIKFLYFGFEPFRGFHVVIEWLTPH